MCLSTLIVLIPNDFEIKNVKDKKKASRIPWQTTHTQIMGEQREEEKENKILMRIMPTNKMYYVRCVFIYFVTSIFDFDSRPFR